MLYHVLNAPEIKKLFVKITRVKLSSKKSKSPTQVTSPTPSFTRSPVLQASGLFEDYLEHKYLTLVNAPDIKHLFNIEINMIQWQNCIAIVFKIRH